MAIDTINKFAELQLDASDDKLTVNKLIEELQPQEKQIVMMRYYKGSTQTEVAKILGISQVQVSRIEKRILKKLRRQMIGNI